MINDHEPTNLFCTIRGITYGDPKVGKSVASVDPELKPGVIVIEDPELALAGSQLLGYPDFPWIKIEPVAQPDAKYNFAQTHRGRYFTAVEKAINKFISDKCKIDGHDVRWLCIDSVTELGELEYPDTGAIRSANIGLQWQAMRTGFRALYQALKQVPVHTMMIGHPMYDENASKFALAIPGGSREKVVALGCNLLIHMAKEPRKPGVMGGWPGSAFYMQDFGGYPAGGQLGAFLPGKMPSSYVGVIKALGEKYVEAQAKLVSAALREGG